MWHFPSLRALQAGISGLSLGDFKGWLVGRRWKLGEVLGQGHTAEPLLTLNGSGLSTRALARFAPGPRAMDRALGP